MSPRTLLVVVSIAVLGVGASPARAGDSDEDSDPDAAYDPIASIGQLGFGATLDSCLSHRAGGEPDRCAFDGTFQIGKVWKATDQVRPGGFLELRTVGFDTFEAAVGPQLQFRLARKLGLQLRGGVGGIADGGSYALAGAQIGTQHLGFSVTARRAFDLEDDPELTTISAQLHVSSLVAVFPLALAIWVGAGP